MPVTSLKGWATSNSALWNKPSTEGLKSRVLSGAAAIGASQAIKLVIQFSSVVLLARLLTPEDFGLFAMVMPVAAFVLMFQDLGLTQATITRSELGQDEASSIFWVSLSVATIFALGLFAASPLVAAFFGEPRLTPLMAALALSVFLSGLVSQPFALLNRQMRFGALAIIDIVSSLFGFAASIAVALIYPTPWAMVASVIGNMVASLLLVWPIVRWMPSRPGRLTGVRDMLHFGGGLTLFNVGNFVARNVDKVLIGRFVGSVSLGFYDRAYRLLLFPLQQVAFPLQRIAVPALSRLVDDPHRYRHAYSRLAQQLLLVTTPGMVMLIIFADPVVALLLGPGWSGVAPIFQWLGVAGLALPLTSSIAWLFTSQGRAVEFGKWGLFSMASCVLAYVIGLPWGAVGVAAAYAISDVFIRVPLIWWWVGRKGPVGMRTLLDISAPFILSGAGSATALLLLRHYLPEPGLFTLIAAGFASYIAGCATLLLIPGGRRVITYNMALAAGMANRAAALATRHLRSAEVAAEQGGAKS